jgi:RNA exonuclease 1
MFTTRRPFGDLPCPLRDSCNRPICLFSHNPTTIPTTSLIFNVPEPAPAAAKAVPAKRRAQSDAPLTPQPVPSSSRPSYPANAERPTKFQKTGSAAKPVALPTASSSSVSKKKTYALSQFPHWYSRLESLFLRSMLGSQRYPFRRARYVTHLVSVQSQCGIRTSYTWPSTSSVLLSAAVLTFWFLHPFSHIKNMLKSLWDHFVVLYNAFFPQNPSLASEHALRQEQEIYERTTKSTYRNVIISVLF